MPAPQQVSVGAFLTELARTDARLASLVRRATITFPGTELRIAASGRMLADLDEQLAVLQAAADVFGRTVRVLPAVPAPSR